MTQQLLNPEVKMVLDMATASQRPKMWTLSPSEAREAYRLTGKILDTKSPPALAEIRDRTVPGADGELKARLYRPKNADGALLVFLHGGGFVIGDLETHDVPCRILAAHSGVSILAIDYRLAPEHKYPAGSDDAVSALSWAMSQARSLDVDPGCIAIGGDSAGGNLSAVACHRLRDQGERLPALQLLIYPGTDFLGETASMRDFADGYFLERKSMDYFRAHYLRDGQGAEPYASPLRATRFDGLPRALVYTAAFDPLRDEGKAYAEKLSAAGIRTDYHCFEGLVHGFMHFTGAVKAAQGAIERMADALREGLKK